jgi:glutamine amidotransferase
MSRTVAVVDTGGANLASLCIALERLGARGLPTNDAEQIRAASHVVLPGVGSAADGMRRLREHGLVDSLRSLTQPVLGICLGLQLLAEASEEDDVECLGILPGTVRRLAVAPGLPVPNMGWCRVRTQRAHGLLDGIADDAWFYLVHGYALPPTADTLAVASHAEPFTAVAARGNFLGTQFHPERSSQAGARLLANFLAL